MEDITFSFNTKQLSGYKSEFVELLYCLSLEWILFILETVKLGKFGTSLTNMKHSIYRSQLGLIL